MEFKNLGTLATLWLTGTTSLFAAGTAVTLITVDGSDITSVTVGSEIYLASSLAPGDSSGGTVDGNVAGLNSIDFVDNYDLDDGVSLTGTTQGSTWKTASLGGVTNYSDTNGGGFDFFMFERGGTDTLNVRPFYSTDGGVNFIQGNSVVIASNGSNWGMTTYVSTFGTNSQNVYGTAFRVTDLLDASGNFLTNDVIISELRFVSPSMDPLVFLVAIPEPSTVGLGGLAVLCLLGRRSRCKES